MGANDEACEGREGWEERFGGGLSGEVTSGRFERTGQSSINKETSENNRDTSLTRGFMVNRSTVRSASSLFSISARDELRGGDGGIESGGRLSF